MGVAKQMGLAMSVIAMKDILIYLLSQTYLASKNVISLPNYNSNYSLGFTV